MGARGPKPTPTPVLEARGSWRAKERADYAEPVFPVGVPDCPAWLDDIAKAEWQRVVPELEAAGVIARVNRAIIAAYCVCWSAWVDAEERIKTGGKVIVGSKGTPMQSPWVKIARSARAEMVKLASEFGMTPASAHRVSPAPPVVEEEEENPKDRFFKAQG